MDRFPRFGEENDGVDEEDGQFLQDLIEEHQRVRSQSSQSTKITDLSHQKRNMTLIDVMLSLKETEPEFYTDQTIKGVIMVRKSLNL